MKNIDKTPHNDQQSTDPNAIKINDFFDKIREAILIGFSSPGLSEAEVIQQAIDANKDIFDTVRNDIDYSKVQVSKGDLHMALNARMRYISLVRLTISWKNSLVGSAKDTDIPYLVYYNVDRKLVVVEASSARRVNGIIDFRINKGTMGDDVHCWMFFVSEDGKLRSDSSYLMSRRSVY